MTLIRSALAVAFAVSAACGGDDAGGPDDAAGSEETTEDPTAASITASTTNDETGATMSASAGEGTESSGGATESSGGEGPGDETTTGGDTTAADGSSSSDGVGQDEETTVEEICEAPGELVACDADTADPFQAMGLGCPGEANEVIPIFNASFSSPDGEAWRIARQYGTAIDPNTNEPFWSPREGEQFLMISSGRINAPDDDGVITTTSNNLYQLNGNPDDKPLPAPMSPFEGSDNGNGGSPFVDCDHVNDCSDTLNAQWQAGGAGANDLLWFQFDTPVPGGTHGFTFDFAYFSAEFPEYVNSTFNDMFVVWSNSETYTGNLCFVNDQPCTVTALCDSDASCPSLAHCGGFGCANPTPEALVGTGFNTDGGGTGWYQAKASAEPGEQLQLTWAVFDMGDSTFDTYVILDNWRWDCEGCVPSEVMGCGIDPM